MSGAAKVKIGLYVPREMLRLIDDQLGRGEIDETLGRSEWIREACRRRLYATASSDEARAAICRPPERME